MENASPQTAGLIADLLRERRTVHDFLPDTVPDDIVLEALDAARWAPNHHRTEPWRFYWLGPDAQRAVAELNASLVAASKGERAAAVKLRRWLAMPGWLVMTTPFSDDALRQREDYAACCCAAQNMMLSLWANGVGMKWTTGKVVREAAFADIVGFDAAAESVVGLFWYGRPAQVIEQRRRELDHCLVRVA